MSWSGCFRRAGDWSQRKQHGDHVSNLPLLPRQRQVPGEGGWAPRGAAHSPVPSLGTSEGWSRVPCNTQGVRRRRRCVTWLSPWSSHPAGHAGRAGTGRYRGVGPGGQGKRWESGWKPWAGNHFKPNWKPAVTAVAGTYYSCVCHEGTTNPEKTGLGETELGPITSPGHQQRTCAPPGSFVLCARRFPPRWSCNWWSDKNTGELFAFWFAFCRVSVG